MVHARLRHGTVRSAVRADTPKRRAHSGSGPSIGRLVKNFAAMQPPGHES
nr:hypothetical protein JVH1_4177 [Rhodococcus sp. JVH1]